MLKFLLKLLSTIFQIATGVCRVQALCLPVDGRPQGSRPTNTCGNLKKVPFYYDGYDGGGFDYGYGSGGDGGGDGGGY